jgi:hypothetical protein
VIWKRGNARGSVTPWARLNASYCPGMTNVGDWPKTDISVLSVGMNENESPAGIGPHEGRELELLLTGEKPVARFRLDGLSEEYEDRFREAVGRGEIVEFDFPNPQLHLHRRFYCRHGEEWRVKVMDLIYRLLMERTLKGFTEEGLHRLDGTLLGYSKADIDLFIERIRSRRE